MAPSVRLSLVAGHLLDHPKAARPVDLDGHDVEGEDDRADQAHPGQLGGDQRLLAAAITATVLGAMLTLPLVLWLLPGWRF